MQTKPRWFTGICIQTQQARIASLQAPWKTCTLLPYTSVPLLRRTRESCSGIQVLVAMICRYEILGQFSCFDERPRASVRVAERIICVWAAVV